MAIWATAAAQTTHGHGPPCYFTKARYLYCFHVLTHRCRGTLRTFNLPSPDEIELGQASASTDPHRESHSPTRKLSHSILEPIALYQAVSPSYTLPTLAFFYFKVVVLESHQARTLFPIHPISNAQKELEKKSLNLTVAYIYIYILQPDNETDSSSLPSHSTPSFTFLTSYFLSTCAAFAVS